MQFASMSLGIFDFLIEWLTKFLIWIVQFALELVGQLISLILYGICVDFLKIVDFIQKMFYKLCGLGSYWVNGVEMKETDPLLSIITDKSVLQVLLALTLVAVAMVIVATIIQVLRTEFSTEGSKNTKGQVFGQAIKALVMFALVPICCGGGILITNALLQAVNTATSLGAESSVGGAVYVASTYSANHIRNGGTIQSITQSTNGNYVIKVKGFSSFMSITKEKEYECTISGEAVSYLGGASLSVDQNNRDEIAQKIDNAFRNGYISFDNKSVANTFYDVGNINFVTFLGGGLLAAYTMLMASFGMIMRMYKGAVLFVISPAMSGLMPLDNGSAFKQWRTAFIKQLLSAYGTIVAMNLLFILLPIVGNITLFGGSTGGAINAFVQMLFTLTGLFMLKDISSLIANMIGADDAGAAGAGMAGKVLGTAAKIGSVAAGGVAGVAMKGLGATAGIAGNVLSKNKPNSKLGKALSMTSKSFGGIGGKMTQRAKGTAGKALNKISNVATGGEFKGPFGEETDFGKAQDAKEKKAKERNERLENGEGSLGDLMGKGVDTAKKFTGKAAGGAIGGLVGGTSNLVTKAAYKFKEMKNGTPMPEVGSFKDALKEGASEGYGSVDKGIGKTYSERYASHQAGSAVAQDTVNELKTSYSKVQSTIDNNSIQGIRDALLDGNSLKASNDVGALLEALNAIADKTEDQKDLIQKLTTLQGQIASTSGNKAAQKRLAGDSNNSFFTQLTDKTQAVREDATKVVANSNITVNVDQDINKQFEQMAKDISNATGRDIKEIKRQIEQIQKKNLEAAKAKKENK
ncbi:MAG: hypothetical protein SPF07_05170 [Eubacteriales bacterium]|nr:hypothetical protein [Eubacteriales bacterium]